MQTKCLLRKYNQFYERVELIPWPVFSYHDHSFPSYELQLHGACPPDADAPCTPSQPQTKYRGPGPAASLGGLQPYTAYRLRVVAHNEAGSVASEWISFTTQKEGE